jgi:hypothetical protein
METFAAALQELYERIPRRHNNENLQEISSILDNYSAILNKIESINAWYEKQTAVFYDSLDGIRETLKMSRNNKLSKKAKDDLFDECSGTLKDDIQKLINVYGAGMEGHTPVAE